MLPSCSGAGPAKPQADNECHTIVTTCTFMERGGRTSLARTLTAYDETSSINQTIKGRAKRHLWNPGREPRLIYDRYQKRAVSKLMCLELNCGKTDERSLSKCNHDICKHCITVAFLHDLPCFPDLNKPHALYEQFSSKSKRLEVFHLGQCVLFLVSSNSHVVLYSIHHRNYSAYPSAFKANVTRKGVALISFQ